VQVVEDADERAFLRSFLQELAEGPGDLLGARLLLALPQQRAERDRSGGIGGKGVELLQQLQHRPVADPLAVGEAAAAHDGRIEISQELVHEPRLAHPGRSQDGEQLAGAVCDRLLEGSP
jgi:hypothetical protein